MKILEKPDRTHRVMVSVFPYNGTKRGKGSKSFHVLDTTVEEVYNFILEALRAKE